MWFNRKRQPPIRSLVCEGSVVRGGGHFCENVRSRCMVKTRRVIIRVCPNEEMP
jgi:hypothetical protein